VKSTVTLDSGRRDNDLRLAPSRKVNADTLDRLRQTIGCFDELFGDEPVLFRTAVRPKARLMVVAACGRCGEHYRPAEPGCSRSAERYAEMQDAAMLTAADQEEGGRTMRSVNPGCAGTQNASPNGRTCAWEAIDHDLKDDPTSRTWVRYCPRA